MIDFKSDYDTIRISNQFSPYSVQMKGDLHVPYLAYRVCGFSGSGRSYHISDQHLVCRGFPGRAGGAGVRRRSVSPAGSVCGSVLHVVSYGPSLCLQVPVRQADKTNVDSLTGRKAVVKDRIDNVAGTGTAILAGETWLARAAEEGDTFEAGDVVVISAVSGAKLLVAAAKQEHEVEKA